MESVRDNSAKAERIHEIVNMLLELDEVTLERMQQALKDHVAVLSAQTAVRER